MHEGIELSWVFSVLRRKAKLIIGFFLLTALVAYFVVSSMEPVYNATAVLLVQPSKDARSSEVNVLTAGERLALTYSQVVRGREVMKKAIDTLGIEMSPGSLASRVTAESVRETQLLRLTVTDSTPERAALLANTIANTFTKHINELTTERYAASLDSVKGKMDEVQADIDEVQAQITSLSENRAATSAELDQLNAVLNGYTENYNDLKREYQNNQLAVGQINESFKIIEEASAEPGASVGLKTATVTLLFGDPSNASAASSNPNNDQWAKTYMEILTSRPVLAQAAEQLGMQSAEELQSASIRLETVPGTQVLRLRADDADGEQAVRIANTVAEVFIAHTHAILAAPSNERLTIMQAQMDENTQKIAQVQDQIKLASTTFLDTEMKVKRLESNLADLRSDYRDLQLDYQQQMVAASEKADTVVLSEPAVAPRDPVQDPQTYTALAGIVGLLLGVGLAFVIELLEDRIRTRQDVQAKLGVKLLGTVTDIEAKGPELMMTGNPGSPYAEDFRKLAINLRLESVNNPFSILLITSPGPREGKSTVLANLAMALARTGISVVAVDANLQSPGLHEVFGIQRRKGLTEAYASGGSDVNLQPTRIENLKVLTAGSDMLIDSTELLNSPRLSDLLHKIASQANIVIVDSPPVTMADTRILASITDGAVMVLRSGVTQGTDAREAIETLRGTRVNLVGVILNGQPGTNRSFLRGKLDPRTWFKQPGETLARLFQRSR